MKVLHVIPSVSMADGGPSRAIRLIARSLVTQGVEVDVASTDDDGKGGYLAPDAINSIEQEFLPARLYLFHRDFRVYKISATLRQWLAAQVGNYDIVHIHGLFSWSCTVAAGAAGRAGVPCIIRPLGTLNRYGIEHHRPWLKQLSLRLVEKKMLARAACVHFTDHQEMDEALLTVPGLKGTVIPLGVEPFANGQHHSLAEQYPVLAGKRVLLFLSRIAPKKNLEALLGAYSLLVSDYPDIHLVIAGDGDRDYVAKLTQLARQLGIGEKLTWTGHVEGENKAALLGGAWMFVLPSFSENFGIAVVEALSAGIPCVLGEGIAIAKAVADAGAGVTVAPTAEAVAGGMMQLLDHARNHAGMRANALALVRDRYSLEAMSAALASLYRDVTGQN